MMTPMQNRFSCGLLASAARFVPVPFLDDMLREKALQLLVSRTIKAYGRTYSSSLVAPLYGDDRGCLHGCLVWLLLLPVKLVLFPIRKLLTWIMTAKNLATDLSEAVLLGRVLDRCLADGRLANDSSRLHAEAALVRQAFSNAIQGTDMRILSGVLAKALRSVSGLPRAAFNALRGLRKRSEEADPVEGVSGADRAKLEAGAKSIESALETPEMKAYLAEFDGVFDENLRILEERAAASPTPG